MSDETREPFGGRWFGIFNVEGDPSALFLSRVDAEREVERRRALPEDHDDRLTEYHQVLPCDVAGAVWNSFDPDPRARNPLDASEILTVHDGTDVPALLADAERLRKEREEARGWVRRLTQGQRMLTCAFCGEAYPPGTPESNHEALTAHVKVCAKHPLRVEIETLRGALVPLCKAARRAVNGIEPGAASADDLLCDLKHAETAAHVAMDDEEGRAEIEHQRELARFFSEGRSPRAG